MKFIYCLRNLIKRIRIIAGNRFRKLVNIASLFWIAAEKMISVRKLQNGANISWLTVNIEVFESNSKVFLYNCIKLISIAWCNVR